MKLQASRHAGDAVPDHRGAESKGRRDAQLAINSPTYAQMP